MLVTLGKWVVLVAMVEVPMLVVPVVALLVDLTLVEWDHVAQVAKQILLQW